MELKLFTKLRSLVVLFNEFNSNPSWRNFVKHLKNGGDQIKLIVNNDKYETFFYKFSGRLCKSNFIMVSGTSLGCANTAKLLVLLPILKGS